MEALTVPWQGRDTTDLTNGVIWIKGYLFDILIVFNPDPIILSFIFILGQRKLKIPLPPFEGGWEGTFK